MRMLNAINENPTPSRQAAKTPRFNWRKDDERQDSRRPTDAGPTTFIHALPSGVRRPPAILLVIAMMLIAIPAAAQEITTAERDGRMRIMVDGEVFCDVVAGNETPLGEIPRPFVYPIYGPTGAMMTRHFPMRDDVEGEEQDHPHHRSLWFAHGDVNDVDFWAQGEGCGRILANGDGSPFDLLNLPISYPCALSLGSDWTAPNGTRQLEANHLIGFLIHDDGSRIIDLYCSMTPGEDAESVTFGDTKEGTMAIRTHPALRLVGEHATGHAINSEGDTDRDLWGKRAAWVAYWGEIDGEACGIAIFDHPENLRHPTYWHARDYGLIAANPFGIHDFTNEPEGTGDYTLEWGESLTLAYRFVFFAGTAEEADIAGKYAQWVEEMEDENSDEAEMEEER